MPDKLSYSAQIFWSIVLVFESFIIITTNAIAINIFSKKNFIICKSAYLLISLTMADVLVGIAPFFHFIEVIYSKGDTQPGCGVVITDISKVYSFFTIMTSLSGLAIIAIERALATFKPHLHRRYNSGQYFKTIVIAWLTSIVCTVMKGFSECSDNSKLVTIFINIMTIFVITCILAIVVSYLSVMIKMKFFSLLVNSSLTFKNNAKLSKTLMITTMVAVFANLPRILFRLVGSRCAGCQYLLTKNADLASNVILYSNSFANVFVYTLRMPAFRKEFKKTICKCTLKRNGIASTNE